MAAVFLRIVCFTYYCTTGSSFRYGAMAMGNLKIMRWEMNTAMSIANAATTQTRSWDAVPAVDAFVVCVVVLAR